MLFFALIHPANLYSFFKTQLTHHLPEDSPERITPFYFCALHAFSLLYVSQLLQSDYPMDYELSELGSVSCGICVLRDRFTEPFFYFYIRTSRIICDASANTTDIQQLLVEMKPKRELRIHVDRPLTHNFLTGHNPVWHLSPHSAGEVLQWAPPAAGSGTAAGGAGGQQSAILQSRVWPDWKGVSFVRMPGRSTSAEMEAKGKGSAPAPWRLHWSCAEEWEGPGLRGRGAEVSSVTALREFLGGGVVGKALCWGG